MKKWILGLICVFHSTCLMAWNALGHQLIAQFAYDQLSSSAKRYYNQKNQLLNQHHKPLSFVNSAVWLDRLYVNDVKFLRPMHYIDLPYIEDNTTFNRPIPAINARWALDMSVQKLLEPHANMVDKAIAFRILLHVAGDVHQPLHTITRVNKTYPLGDKGGNLVLLAKNPIGKNLHAYWDRGGGLLLTTNKPSRKKIQRMAYHLEQKYPCDSAHVNINPHDWINESHQLAINYVYKPLNKYRINESYQTMSQAVVEKQLAKAGCRLGTLLNKIYTANRD